MRPAVIPFEYTIDVSKAYEDEGRWIVEGFAATSDFDLQEDIISQEAIETSAKDLIENSTVLHNHKADESIGKVLASEARKGGLFLKILVSKTVPDLWQKIKEGVLNKFSVRGKILEAKKQWVAKLQKFARLILKMRLVEVSLVAVPANPKARAIRWYIEKAMEEFEANGGEIAQMGGENENTPAAPEAQADETQVVTEEEVVLYEASGERQGEASDADVTKAVPPNAPTTVRMQEIAMLVGKLIPGEQNPDRRRLLDLIRVMAMGAGSQAPPTAPSDTPSKTEGEEGGTSDAGSDSSMGTPASALDLGITKADRTISKPRLRKLRRLMAELQKIIDEVEPDTAEAKKDGASEAPDEVDQKLSQVESALDRISKALGIEPGKEGKEPVPLAKTVDALTKRLDSLEGLAGARASLEGQEDLPGTKPDDKSVWKGLL